MNPENAAGYLGTALCLHDLEAPDDAHTMFAWAVRLNPEYKNFEKYFDAMA